MSGDRRIDAEDEAARQPNVGDGVTTSMAYGCLKLGNDDIEEYNNNFELQQRHRFTSQRSDRIN